MLYGCYKEAIMTLSQTKNLLTKQFINMTVIIFVFRTHNGGLMKIKLIIDTLKHMN